MSKPISIAIDGPAGSGKSTIAKIVASKFDYIYIDTGAMYRALTLKALQNKIAPDDGPRLTTLLEQTRIELKYKRFAGTSQLQVMLDGEDVSEAIRTLEVTNNVSAVSAVAEVRTSMVKLQQQLASQGGVVMDGRDICAVVLPKAELKLFLTASVEERSQRRWLELQEKGIQVDIMELQEQIRHRDYLDSHREINPLRQAADALLLDTTGMPIDQVVAKVVELAQAKGARMINDK